MSEEEEKGTRVIRLGAKTIQIANVPDYVTDSELTSFVLNVLLSESIKQERVAM